MSVLPSCISLFTGAGGLDLGLERAGFHTVTAVESDPDAVATLAHNQSARIRFGGGRTHLSGTRLLAADIATLGPADLRPAGVGRGWVPDLMAGGPPCQPFSSSGKMRSVADPRGTLFEQFVRLAAGLRPKLVLFENVRGLVTARGPRGEPGEVLSLVRSAFEQIGYATSFALRNAADYGVPQRRVRCFMLATRCTRLPTFPEPTHAEKPSGGLFDRTRPWVTLGEFLAGQPEPSADEVIRPTPVLAGRLAGVAPGSGLKSAGARETTRPGGHWGYRQGTFVADPKLPARTVTASASQDWVRLADESLRRLTLAECAGLQGFPDEWVFRGPTASRFRQVGNAVPVALGEALGRELIAALAAGGRAIGSAPFPAAFTVAVEYTRREQRRNGASRAEVRRRLGSGADVSVVKGLGSDDPAAA